MAWNKNLPANNSKIRLSPAYIRDNWTAIETGLVPYDYLQMEKQAADPSTTANTGWFFSKADSVLGYTEAFYKNSNGSTVQLTLNGAIGSSATSFFGTNFVATGYMQSAQGFTIDGTYKYAATNFITARASIGSGGAATQSDGITSSRLSTGIYEIVVSLGRLTVNSYQIIATPLASGSTTILNIVTKPVVNAATTTTIQIETKERSGGSHINAAFEVIIVGGR